MGGSGEREVSSMGLALVLLGVGGAFIEIAGATLMRDA